MSDDSVSAVHLRQMSEDDWARVMAGEPALIARYVRSAAEAGFKSAQLVWGQMLLDGRDVARDPAAAFRWFSRAAAIGSPDGVNMVGRCHELGWGVPVDHREAAQWFRKAADKGSDWGAYNLGCLLLYGDIDRDPTAALGWLRRSAEGGNAKAPGLVGRCLDEGWGARRDAAAAASWYRRGAGAGDCWAQYNLAAVLLEAGDLDGAESWLWRSLDTGMPNYWRAAGEDLLQRDEARLRTIGQAALERASLAAATRAVERGQASVWMGLRRLARLGAAAASSPANDGRRRQPPVD